MGISVSILVMIYLCDGSKSFLHTVSIIPSKIHMAANATIELLSLKYDGSMMFFNHVTKLLSSTKSLLRTLDSENILAR
jgi:hypothetical protein